MKKALKMFSLTLIAFIALGVTNVKADGMNFYGKAFEYALAT